MALLRDQLLEVSHNYDAVIIDLGAGVERNVRMLAASASQALIVVTDEPTSLTDAYAFIKLGSAAGQSKNYGIVVNQATSLMEGEKTYKNPSQSLPEFFAFNTTFIRYDPS